jgi:hypothetical protein
MLLGIRPALLPLLAIAPSTSPGFAVAGTTG